MSPLRHRVQCDLEFDAPTDRDFDALVRLAHEVAGRAGRPEQTRFEVVAAADGQIVVRARAPRRDREQMRLLLIHDRDARRVSLRVDDFTSSRPVVAGFIPVGPPAAPALGPARRFATCVRQGL